MTVIIFTQGSSIRNGTRDYNGLGNLAVTGADHLAAVVKNWLKRIQYRPDLLTSFLAQTALTLDPEPL